jgi:beta-glucosidase
MAALGVDTYRMSLEWARIEPEERRFDEEALPHYRREVEGLVARGIRPLVTLHHFSNPLWFEDSGGFEDARSVERFVRYARRAVKALGDVVSDWVTINEPNIYMIFGYIFGEWPPGKTDFIAAAKVARHLTQAHRAAYRAIHEARAGLDGAGDDGRTAAGATAEPTRVGVAHHLCLFDPARPRNLLDRAAAALYDYVTQGLFLRGMVEGHGAGDGGVLRNARGYVSDFLGINYYSRDYIRFRLRPGSLFGDRVPDPSAPKSDLDWEIYPEGLFRIAERMWHRFRLPIYITENGTADAEDAFRSSYIASHLAEVGRAIEAGSTFAATTTGVFWITSNGRRGLRRGSVSTRSTTKPKSAGSDTAAASSRRYAGGGAPTRISSSVSALQPPRCGD